LKLRFYVQQFVRRVFVFHGNADGFVETPVDAVARRRNVFQIAKNPARQQTIPDFLVELPLSFMHQMMNGETRRNDIEHSEIGKGAVEIMFQDSNSIAGTESFL